MHFLRQRSFRLIILFSLVITNSFAAKPAKNAIFFIGDGMGPAIITAARIYQGGSYSKLFMESLSITGLSRTVSSSDMVTDSAAAATALASGVKTYNGAVGYSDKRKDPKKVSRKLQTILDIALRADKAIGIITTTNVTHATPAAFYAHVPNRESQDKIAEQIGDINLSFLLGGGNQYITEKITARLKKKGWDILKSKRELLRYPGKKNVLGVFNDGHLSYEMDKKLNRKLTKQEPSLSEMVKWGIKKLKKHKNGYILIVEGGRIDHGAHDNNTRYALEEVLEFDRAIQVAINATNNETLKIVTADHNTGGLTINGYSRSSNIRGEKLLGNVYGGSGDRSYLTWATGPGEKSPLKAPKHMEASHQHKATAHMKKSAHTAVDVPILSSGRGAINLSGYMHNSDIPHRILMAMGLRFSSPINIANYLDKTKKKKE